MPRYYLPPNPLSSVQTAPAMMSADYSTTFPRSGLEYPWTSSYANATAVVGGGGGPDYGYGTCNCPHCSSEKHLRSTLGAGQSMAYASWGTDADAMKSRVVESGGTAGNAGSWMWSAAAAGCPKAPQVSGLLSSATPYASYATGASMMSAVVDPTDGYVATHHHHHHHHNSLWKGAPVPATSATPYLSLPYSFN